MTSVRLTNPQGAMIIWNYEDRLSSDTSPSNTSELSNIFIPTSSIIGMSTSKSKGGPNGGFQVALAPTFNWMSRITAGSWCVILMSADTEIENLDSVGQVDERTFRMLGRIESVRMQNTVDDSGARHQQFIVTGVDWADVFNSVLYIDPIAVNNSLTQTGNIGQAQRLLYGPNQTGGMNNGAPSTYDIAKQIMQLWGSPLPDISSAAFKTTGISTTSEAQYTLPIQVSQYMGFSNWSKSNSFADLISIQNGPLDSGYDTYNPQHVDAQAWPAPATLLGSNTLWSLLTMYSNPILNETFTDIRFEGGGGRIDSFNYDASKSTPYPSLYKRIRPFTLRNKIEGDAQNPDVSSMKGVYQNISYFKNVRKILIPTNSIISVDAGTNWKNKKNFIEISPRMWSVEQTFDVNTKSQMQTLDPAAYQREGFRPLIETATMGPITRSGMSEIPKNTQNSDIFEYISGWKYLLRDWHFNAHLMLNGTVSFVGIDRYIQVGDNICIDARVLGMDQNYSDTQLNNREDHSTEIEPDIYMMAHVEGVSHNMQVSGTGARSFISTVSFVRGVFVNKSGELIDQTSHGLLDDDSSKLTNKDERLDSANVKTELGLDPFRRLEDR